MRIILRQIAINLLVLFLVTSIVLGITFLLFPIEDIQSLITTKLFNLSYLAVVGIIILVAGLLIGILGSQLWKQHIYYMERQLDQLIHGQSLINEEYKDLKQVDERVKQLQKKIASQVEHAQRLATERANEREASLQEIVVQERNRLARDLHDSVSQQLFAASMMMSAITESNQTDDPALNHQIKMVEKMIQQSQLEMRALLLHLRPVQLKGKKLQEGIMDLLSELMSRLPIELDYNIEDFSIEKGIEDQLFRILQEAVSNTLRHAEAASIKISLIKREGFIIMRISDDGKGFEMKDTGTGSYGLDTMKERSQDLGGDFKVVSLPNRGTRIEVKIPAIHEDGENDD
ncbi:sensor histidine kinase [Pseudogracilibacillus sp. SE30717A]|uniref:sensor histidine kinase n=1 Tax=Pseudogracilibacillus sp. SE30717A TaxID=3098293 RepID=UPI00300DDC3E